MMRRSCLSLFLLSACAPVADFRPPSALVRDDRTFEAGAGVVHVSPRPYVQEEGHNTGQAWFTGRPTKWLLLSGIAGADAHSVLGGGAALARFLRTDRFVAAGSVEAGFAWGAASLSGGARLFDDTWVYTAPRFFNWGMYPAVGIPVGVSARIVDGFILRAEGQLSWQNFRYYNRRTHLGLAAAYEW